MTLLFTVVIIGKKVKIGLRQSNVIVFIASTELHHVQNIFIEKTGETLEIT